MNKYTTSSVLCEAEFSLFAKKVLSGFSVPEKKFGVQMLSGISKSKSVVLSEIARNSIKGVTIKKAVERFSRHLCNFDGDKFQRNYIKEIEEILPEQRLYIVDDSEIVKPCAKKMEGLGWVADGSDKHKLKQGYFLNEIVAIDKNKQPVSVASKLYTANEREFESSNHVTQKAIKDVIGRVGSGVFIFDRGFDDVKLHRFLVKNRQKYIIRTKSTRNIICNDMEKNVLEFAKMLKGKYSFSIKFQDGIKANLKASFKRVYLPKMPETHLNLVVVYGFSKDENEPFYLLTNLNINDKDSCLNAVGVYLGRWKIEEYFKFKKQAYQFENVRIRTLAALKTLNLFLTAAIGFLAKLGNTGLKKTLTILAQPIKNKATFLYYRLYAGFLCLTQMLTLGLPSTQKIRKIIPKQKDLFHYLHYVKPRQKTKTLKNGET
jgi:hypothetical protein